MTMTHICLLLAGINMSHATVYDDRITMELYNIDKFYALQIGRSELQDNSGWGIMFSTPGRFFIRDYVLVTTRTMMS